MNARKFVYGVLAFVAGCSAALDAAAQERRQQPSPFASVTQRIGVSDVTIEYCRPGVKGRVIWGQLTPYDQPWRAGANATTKFTFESDVKIEGQPLVAGSYGFFVIPSERGEWTLIFSKNFGTNGTYPGEDQDALRVKVRAQDAPHQERLVYGFEDLVDDQPAATVVLHWEKKKVSFKIETGAK
jgi:hypothetical protein